MSEYIEREALRAKAIRLTGGDEFVFDNCFPYWQFSKSIKEAPAADVAPVVRCVDCDSPCFLEETGLCGECTIEQESD
jgi:hypothetical protein